MSAEQICVVRDPWRIRVLSQMLRFLQWKIMFVHLMQTPVEIAQPVARHAGLVNTSVARLWPRALSGIHRQKLHQESGSFLSSRFSFRFVWSTMFRPILVLALGIALRNVMSAEQICVVRDPWRIRVLSQMLRFLQWKIMFVHLMQTPVEIAQPVARHAGLVNTSVARLW